MIETHEWSIYAIESTYNVGVHTDVEDEGSGRHPLAPAEEVDGDGDLQHAAGHRDHRHGDRVPSVHLEIDHTRTSRTYSSEGTEQIKSNQMKPFEHRTL